MMIRKLPQPFHAARAFGVATCLAALITSLTAKPIPSNIDFALEKLVQNNLTVKAAATNGQTSAAVYNGYATEEAASYAAAAVTEPDSGRVMVDITLRGHATLNETL